ncbi:hypothetical protein [Thermococcus prieurii]
MRKALLVLAMVAVVLAAGCMGGTTEKPTSSEGGTAIATSPSAAHEATGGSQTTSSGTAETSTGTSGTVTSLEEIASLGHVELFRGNGVGIKVYVEGSSWVSSGNAYNTRFDYAPMFYSGGNLYVYQYADESFSYAYEDGTLKEYPFIVLAIPVKGVDFTLGGPSGSILVVSDDGTLHFISYDTDEYQKWPEDKPKIAYFRKIKAHETWKLGVENVVAGSDGSDEYVYYVAWGGNKAYVIGMTAEEALKLARGDGSKPQAREFTFDSGIKDVLIGNDGIYVLSGGKLYIINIADGPGSLGITETVDAAGAGQMSLDTGENYDYLALYNGSTVLVMRVSEGRVKEKASYPLTGFERVQVYVRSGDIDLTAVKGGEMVFYDVSLGSTSLERMGYVALPAGVKWFEGSYPYAGATVVLWDENGNYYKFAANLTTGQGGGTSGGSNETGTSETSGGSGTENGSGGTETETSTQSTSTPSASTSSEGSLKYFLENAYTVEGFVYTRDGHSYRGIKIRPKLGRLYYFPYGYDSVIFLVYGDKVLSIVPWDPDFFDGTTDKPSIDPYDTGAVDLILLPVKARLYYSLPNEDYAAMVDQNGRLHILMGLKRHVGDEIEWYTFMSDAVYSFNASGIVAQSFWSNYLVFAWKGSELRVYIYNSDATSEMWNGEANVTVEPRVYSLPGRIREVNPYIADQFVVVLTDEGTYILPNPVGRYKDDTNVYRIDGRVDLIGAYHYWYLDELLAYSNGKLYGLAPDYSNGKVSVEKGPYTTVPSVVGLYGANDQDEFIALSLGDGTLAVYQHVWNDQKQGYEFAFRKNLYLPAPLVRLTFDYRPDIKWTRILGLGTDGSFYNFEVRW